MEDFNDIKEYTERLNYNVLRAIDTGVFEKSTKQKFKIPNLMVIEDEFIFGDEHDLPGIWDQTNSLNDSEYEYQLHQDMSTISRNKQG